MTNKKAMVNTIVGVVVGVLIITVLVSAFFPTIKSNIASTTNLTATESSIYNMVPLFLILVVFLAVLGASGLYYFKHR